jgi:hypothetical protein
MSDVRRELSRVYRLSRKGDIDVQDATRYAYVLRVISEMIIAEDMEGKLDTLEGVATQVGGKGGGLGVRGLTQLRSVS